MAQGLPKSKYRCSIHVDACSGLAYPKVLPKIPQLVANKTCRSNPRFLELSVLIYNPFPYKTPVNIPAPRLTEGLHTFISIGSLTIFFKAVRFDCQSSCMARKTADQPVFANRRYTDASCFTVNKKLCWCATHQLRGHMASPALTLLEGRYGDRKGTQNTRPGDLNSGQWSGSRALFRRHSTPCFTICKF